jgi:hypothetical protein
LGYRTRYARLLAKTETTNTNKSSSPRQKQHKAEPKTTHPNQKRITQQKNNEQTTQTTQKHNNPPNPPPLSWQQPCEAGALAKTPATPPGKPDKQTK